MSLDKALLNSFEQKAPRYGEGKANTGNATMDALAPLIASIAGDIAALKRKVAALEARPSIKFMGVYKPGATYSEGSMVTRDGSIFHANKTTTATPGDGSMDWTLCVKRGRDGKDGVSR